MKIKSWAKNLSSKSISRLKTCHIDLQIITNEVAKTYDFSILEGHRSKEVQNEYFDLGKSKIRWPDGKHNQIPSEAIDIITYHKANPHYRWTDIKSFSHLAGFFQATAERLFLEKKVNHVVRWGGDWDSDRDTKDQSFHDLPHLELSKPSQLLVQRRNNL